MTNRKKWYSFWQWLLFGYGGNPGYTRVIKIWLILDILIGLFSSILVQKSISDIAIGILVPLSGVFIGLSATVSSGTQALISSKEINYLAKFKDGGIADYVYPFQLAILFILISMSFWGIAASGLLDFQVHILCIDISIFSMFGLALTSSCIRLAWGCVSGGSDLIFAVFEVREATQNQETSTTNT